MNLIAMLLYGDGFVVAVTHGAKLPAQELLLFLCRVDADFDNVRVDADFDNVKHVISGTAGTTELRSLSKPMAVLMVRILQICLEKITSGILGGVDKIGSLSEVKNH